VGNDSDGDNIGDVCDVCPQGDPNIKISVPKTITGSNVMLTIELENYVQPDTGLDFHIDFGDGTTKDIHTSAMSTTISYSYAKPGDYKITVNSDAASGCAAGSDEVEIDISNNRVAPKCSEIGVTALLKRK